MTLGEKLTNARKAKKLSQIELAKKSGYNPQCIAAWESDILTPDEVALQFLCKVLDISPADLLPSDSTEYPINDTFLSPQNVVSDASASYAASYSSSYQTATSPTAEATSADYWNLTDNIRAELIDGKLYYMATPSILHQHLLMRLCVTISNHIDSQKGSCIVLPAPIAVNLNENGKTWVEPDIMVVCDRNKLDFHSCKTAPDFVIEIVSPSSRRMDYITKSNLYADAGVREYWIIDPDKKCTTVYHFEVDASPIIIPFDQMITIGIFGDLCFCIGNLIDMSLYSEN